LKRSPRLAEVSLVKHDPFEDGTPAVTVHRLVQAVARARSQANGSAQDAIGRLIARLVAIYPDEGYRDPPSWPLCAHLTPHLLAQQEAGTDRASMAANWSNLLNRAGSYFYGRAAYSRAAQLLRDALAIREKVLGPEHPNMATSMSNLARLLTDTGHANEAEPLFLKAIAIGGKALGCNHSLTQRYASHYAHLLLETGRAAEALTVAQSALATHEAASGRNYVWTKDSTRVTAAALDALGRTEEAKALRERYGVTGQGK
jgi:tetratricopeptide (TPR) repeat protein